MSQAGAALGLAMVLLELARGAPQPIKLWRRRSAAGVSGTSSAVLCVLASVWLLYALVARAWPAAAAAAVAMASCTATAVLVAGLTSAWAVVRPGLVAGGLVGVVMAAGAVLGSQQTATALLLLGGTAAYGAPRLVTGLRAPSLAGVSMWYLGLSLADAVVFGVYGASAGLWAYAGYGALQTAATLPVMVRWWARPALRAAVA